MTKEEYLNRLKTITASNPSGKTESAGEFMGLPLPVEEVRQHDSTLAKKLENVATLRSEIYSYIKSRVEPRAKAAK